MKDIFKLLNDADLTPEQHYDVKLTENEQNDIYHMLTSGAGQKRSSSKHIKRILASAALLGFVITGYMFNPKLITVASNIVDYFTDHSKTDYAKKINQSSGNMELVSMTREGREINLQIKLSSTEDIRELAELCFDKSRDINGKKGYDYNGPEGFVLDAPPFQNCSILINGRNVKEIMDTDDTTLRAESPFEFISVRNIDISKNTLVQNIELTLPDENYKKDFDISFRYGDIELSKTTLNGEWNLDYTISNKEYPDTKLKQIPIELTAKGIDGSDYKLNAYSVTPAGIKFYGSDTWIKALLNPEETNTSEPKVSSTVRLKAYDNLGNQYLLYPGYDPVKYTSTYHIYSGLADENDEYLDQWDGNAKTLTIAFEENRAFFDENDRYINEENVIISDEITLDISKIE